MKKPYVKNKAIHHFRESLILKVEDPIHYTLYSWPMTPLTYCVDFSTASIRVDELVLYNGLEQIPFQISNAVFRTNATLLFADIAFIADLPTGETRVFRLKKGTPQVFDNKIHVTQSDEGITISNTLVQIKLPLSCEYPRNPSGPILAMKDSAEWIGCSQLMCNKRKVVKINTECIEAGLMFIHYRIGYVFEGDANYTADIRLFIGLDFVELDEQTDGIDAGEQICWRFDLCGFEPTHRYAPNNPGKVQHHPDYAYEDYPWHKIDEPYVESFTHPMDLPTTGENGELPFRLNVFETQNAVARNKNACFWDERTNRSVGIFLRNSENWNNEQYDIFTSRDDTAIKYYYENDNLRWCFPIANGTRSLGLTVYSHEKDKRCFQNVIDVLRGFGNFPAPKLGLFAVSYANYLENWYNTLNLDKIKEYTLTYPKNGKRPEKICSYSSFKTPKEMLEHMFTYLLIPSLPLYGASINCGFSGVPYRRMSKEYFNTYNLLYDQFSDSQREQAEALLLLLLYLAQGECCTPMFVMHGGPPNLLVDVKRCLGQTACLFPEHPDFEWFMQTFEKLIPLTSLFMTRPPLKQYMLKGGRWAESPGTYVWAYLHQVLNANAVAQILENRKNTACTNQIDMLGQWLIHSLTAPFGGDNPEAYDRNMKNDRYWGTCFPEGEESRRLHLPQGAHAARRPPPNTMWHLALALERFAPITAENLRYVSHFNDIEAEEHGRSELYEVLSTRKKRDNGTRPEFRSCAFTGYGVILRSGVETKQEVSVHLQQIDGGPNYRWGTTGIGGNGAIYYYAGGKAYSHNGSEEIGDALLNDCDAGCMFGVWKGYKYCSIGPNVLANGYYDMGNFQFAKIDSEVSSDSYAWPEYQSRSVTLSHNDYLLVYDEVGAPTVKTRFAWSVARYDEMPNIQMLTRTDNRWDLLTPESKTVWYHGMGDSVALVSHEQGLSGSYSNRCYLVRKEGEWTDYILRSPQPVDVDCDAVTFKGTSGAVRIRSDGTYSLALFDGSLLKYKDFIIETQGDNQVAVSLYDKRENTFEGRVVSLYGAKIKVSRENSTDELYIDGMKAILDERGFTGVSKGDHKLSLTRAGHLPVPAKAQILHIASGSGRASIKCKPVAGAQSYKLERSRDGGKTWQCVASQINSKFSVDGLENDTKYHFRITAKNAEYSGEPSHEYPAFISGAVPQSPEGLVLKLTDKDVSFSWGEILGAFEYVLYARKTGEDFNSLSRGQNCSFTYEKTDTEIVQYAVAAINLNGEGAVSEIIDDNPSSLANWMPPKDTFDSNTWYNHHPFYANNIHQFKPSPEQYPVSE